jgi:polar amino acid transport system substrate-binding protein
MRRAAVLVLLLVITFSGCSHSSGTSTLPMPTLRTGKLVVCTDIPYEPFEFGDPGNERGIDIDIVKAIASDHGLQAEFHDTDFDTIFDRLTAGDCDLIASSVSITDERKKSHAFSDGYFEVNQSLMVRSADAAKYPDLTALQGHRIGVQGETTGADYAMAHASKSTVVPFENLDDLVRALDNGEIDGVVQDFPINSYRAQMTGRFTVVKTFTDVQREQYGFVMPKSSEQLRAAIDASLEQIRKDGRYDQILSRYLGTTSNH